MRVWDRRQIVGMKNCKENQFLNSQRKCCELKKPCLFTGFVLISVILMFVCSENLLNGYMQGKFMNYRVNNQGSFQKTNHGQKIKPMDENSDIFPTGKNITKYFKIVPDLIQAKIMIPYADPKTYVGPIIEGWSPLVSKYMPIYIKPQKNTVINDISCLQLNARIEILIIVQSAPQMLERRMANRKSWIRRTMVEVPEIQVLFLFGKSQQSQNTDQLLFREQQTHCDTVQMDFIDHYSNVTFDTIMAMKYTLNVIKKHKPDKLKFLMIVDDDSFVNVKTLKEKLLGNPAKHKQPIMAEDSNWMYGYEIRGKAHVPEAGKFKPNQILPKVAWCYSPTYMYNGRNFMYPPFLSGSGYVIPIQYVYCLYEATLNMPFFHLNDVLVTGFAREACKMKLLDDKSLFFPMPNKRWKKESILYHYMDTDSKIRMDSFLKS